MSKIVFFTGAGISVAAGLPTYRGEDGKYTPGSSNFVPPIVVNEKLSTAEFIAANESIRSLRKELSQVKPTQAHRDIAGLQVIDDVTVVTQNIDNLHRVAGSQNVIELHGNAFVDYESEAWGCERVNVTFFGEQLDPIVFDAALTAVEECDIFVSVGTSAAVYPAASIMEVAFERRWKNPSTIEAIHIDPALPEIQLNGAKHWKMTADEGLEQFLIERLKLKDE